MFKTLQMGRAIAAVSVCAFHLSLAFDDVRFGDFPLFGEITRFGRHGVDFFFALSGFIILYAHRRDIGRPAGLKMYAVKRFLRIYPLYWIISGIFVANLLLAGRAVPADAADIASAVLLVRFTPVATPLLPAWTLFHEIFFYAVFSAMILRRWLGVAVCLGWIAAILFWDPAQPYGERTFASMATKPINLCFFGGMAACCFHRLLGIRTAGIACVAGAAVLAGTIAWIDETGHPLVFAVSMAAAFALLIIGSVALERHGAIPEIRWLALVGNASYALYLSHLILLYGILKGFYLAGLANIVGLPVLFFLALAGAIVAGVCIHLYIERPMQRRLGMRFTAGSP